MSQPLKIKFSIFGLSKFSDLLDHSIFLVLFQVDKQEPKGVYIIEPKSSYYFIPRLNVLFFVKCFMLVVGNILSSAQNIGTQPGLAGTYVLF